VYDGNGDGRRTAEEFAYGPYGTLVRSVQLGEVRLQTGEDIPGDTRTVETEYRSNTDGDNWLLGLPVETTVRDASGNAVRRSWFYYDGLPYGSVPSKGLLTKKEDASGLSALNSRGNAENPVTQYTYYEETGNLRTTTDTLGHATTITYDDEFALFPDETQNAIGHTVLNSYYGVDVPQEEGDYRGLWGQLKSTTDPNEQEGTRVYDSFGRAVKSVSPLDSVFLPTSTMEYAFEGSYYLVNARGRKENQQDVTVDRFDTYDGLGRLIQTLTRSHRPGEFIVSGRTEYDSRGLPVKKYLPYFAQSRHVIDLSLD